MQASERGRWNWDEGQRGKDGEWTEKPGLVYKGDFRSPTRRYRYSLSSITTTVTTASSGIIPAARATAQFGELSLSQLEERKQEEALLVTLEDVKAVAVGHISTSLLKKMKKCTTVVFDEFYRMDAMNNFLWATLLYFAAFLAHNTASSNENVKVPGALGEEARKALREARQKLAQAQVNLGQQYSELVTGQSHKETHHSLQGSLRVSKVHRDQHLYEVIYEFAMYVTWITFGYKDWMYIHKELGRLFKTPAFNRDMKVKGEATVSCLDDMGYSMDTKSDEYLSYRVHYDRPAKGGLKELRSPVLVSYFATPKERNSWAFEPPYRPVSQKKPASLLPTSESPPEKLGVIGELMSEVDPDTLKYKKENDEEEVEDNLDDLTDDFKIESVLFEGSDSQDQ